LATFGGKDSGGMLELMFSDNLTTIFSGLEREASTSSESKAKLRRWRFLREGAFKVFAGGLECWHGVKDEGFISRHRR